MSSLKGKYAIVGVGETDIRNGARPDISQTGLMLQACKRAIFDAGLTNKDVDGVLCNQAGPTFIHSIEIAQGLGIQPKFSDAMEMGGATPAGMVQVAMMAIEHGLAEVVVCVEGEKQRTRHAIPRPTTRILWGYDEFDAPYGHTGPITAHAMGCRQHMHKYGTTHEALGALAVACRKHAGLNANAQQKAPLTIEEYHMSRWVVEPFHLLDCCQVTDGAGAVVVTSAERARTLKKKPIYIIGYGQHHIQRFYNEAIPDLTTLAAEESAKRAYQVAGITPKDVDAAELYDCFTYTLLCEIEDYGFCKKGEGKDFVLNGNIELGGTLPVNTNGGLLSQGHLNGMFHMSEAVKQLRGGEIEPARQIKDPEIIVCSGHGGQLSTHATLILSDKRG